MTAKDTPPGDTGKEQPCADRLARLEADIADKDQRLEELRGELATARQREREALARADSLQDELDDLRAVHKQAVEQLQLVRDRLGDKEARLRQLDEKVVRLEQQQDAHGELQRRIEQLEKERDDALARIERMRAEQQKRVERGAHERVAELTAELQAVRTQYDADWKDMEQRLVERGEKIAALERDLEATEQLVRELVMRVEEPSDLEVQNAQLREQVASLSGLAARQQVQLIAEKWRVAQLEACERDKATEDYSPSEREKKLREALQSAHAQLDALRQALLAAQGQGGGS